MYYSNSNFKGEVSLMFCFVLTAVVFILGPLHIGILNCTRGVGGIGNGNVTPTQQLLNVRECIQTLTAVTYIKHSQTSSKTGKTIQT